MSLNRVIKSKSEDTMNSWSYAVLGDKLKKTNKKLMKRKFRTEVKKDTLKEIRESDNDV